MDDALTTLSGSAAFQMLVAAVRKVQLTVIDGLKDLTFLFAEHQKLL